MLQVNILVTEMQDGTLAAKISREVGPLLAEGRELRDSGKVPRGIIVRSYSATPAMQWSGAVSAVASVPEFKPRKIRGRE